MLHKFNIAKELLKAGIFMRRHAWGYGCFVYYNKNTNKYYTQSGNEIKLKKDVYKDTHDWESLEDFLKSMDRKQEWYNNIYKEVYKDYKKVLNQLEKGEI